MHKQMRSHVPPKPEPDVPERTPGDIPVDPDTDQPDIDLPPPDEPNSPQHGHGSDGAPGQQNGRRGSGLYRMRLLRGRAHAL